MNLDTAQHDDVRPSQVRWLVLGWLCAMAAIAYLHRQAIAVPVTQIQEDLGLDDFHMGLILSGFFLTYSVLQIPGGWLGIAWGNRRALPLFAAVWTVATALMSVGGFGWLLLMRLVSGGAQAGAFPCAVGGISRWFPSWQRSFPNSLLGSTMSVGAIVASSAIAYLLTWMTWQAAFFWLALPGFLWAAGFYVWFRDTPAEHPAVNAAERELIQEGKPAEEPGPAPPVPWLTLFTSSLMLLICLQQFCRAAAYGFYQSWFPTYLQKTRDVEVGDSGYLNSLAMTGYVLGSICAGMLSDWIQARTGRKRFSRQALALVSMAGSALSLLAAHFIADATQAVLMIAVGMFWAGLSGPVGYSITIDTGGRHVTAVFSTMNMCGNLGAFLMPSVVGWLVGLPSVDWDDVLLLFVGLYAAAGVCWLLINPEGSIFKDNDAS